MKTKLNIKLLRRTVDFLAKRPKRFEITRIMTHLPEFSKIDGLPRCGTVGCLAGWGLHLAGHDDVSINTGWEQDARKLFGLTSRQAYVLFFYCGWPEPFRLEPGRYKRNVEVLRKRVEYFIRHRK